MPDKKVMIFIDGSNLYHGAKKTDANLKIDMLKLVEFLRDGRDLIRPYYYGSFDSADQDYVKFQHFLEMNGFAVSLKPLRERNGKKIEKGADVSLVTDLVVMAAGCIFDVAIVVSGDSDFENAIKAVKGMGRRVEIASFDCNANGDIRRIGDRYISLDCVKDKIKKA